CMQAREFPFTF
nr:immunoglobulin light chain junction region [Macaca mulatta]MOV77710.1 immunoglobulin light chain junction region [Macaca mulatta]MOV77800.1 immunoglobulin light chain junction region [Macaca mulatta]MOV77875.1 immunoglobulin light chain junction region [Macaca mulatta]MOV78122.1 immunoglobulin light chain junction region [Macaca mulatta]